VVPWRAAGRRVVERRGGHRARLMLAYVATIISNDFGPASRGVSFTDALGAVTIDGPAEVYSTGPAH
jgi:hypothetical protein